MTCTMATMNQTVAYHTDNQGLNYSHNVIPLQTHHGFGEQVSSDRCQRDKAENSQRSVLAKYGLN